MTDSAFRGQDSAALLSELRRCVVTDPWPFVVDLERSRGMWLATVDGRMLFDWAGYYGSKLIGHNHPRLSEPEYVRRLALAANNKTANPDFLTPECLEYYRLLRALAPRCMAGHDIEVYAVNSGAEAVENMMKYFINLHLTHLGPSAGRRRRFIYFDQAFHGRTVFALNVTQMAHDPIITRDYMGFGHDNIRAQYPAVDPDSSPEVNAGRTRDTLKAVDDMLLADRGEVVGIIVEPLQGAGGHRVASPEFYRGLSELAHRHRVFLGIDEVQTAGGQTGTFFAVDQFDLPHPPQAVAAAKKLGCGVVYMLETMEDRGVLDSTWGGSLADMVRFVQEMRIVRDERLIEQVPDKARHLQQRLEELSEAYPEVIRGVRGMGLYMGFTARSAALKACIQREALNHEDTILLGAGTDSIRLRPNLHVDHGDIDLLAEKLGRVFAAARSVPSGEAV